ncbi:NUDIX hydrolase [Mangrovicoccus algicola]|uniref:NUDIX domain-containing protein n=1 Tax=Mangrovicoccus algicola TaxID=2771008 RepID=A0A8J6YXW5_9RHOB|nr:NUDIX domain-containing protein [Mangrovicoccus algicola]MBE3639757.1 NUDIX domain-containing protein [Mangrovicoccus algicola]
MPEPPIRDAATVILLRDRDGPQVLMGRRAATAVFMPSKSVFPGGAVDPGDAAVPLAGLPDPVCMERLAEAAAPGLARALVAAAIRETWEETGLILGPPGAWPQPPPDWAGLAAAGRVPSGAGLRFVFRALTPPGRPRRFDARFFLADADALGVAGEDFARASGELADLRWIPLEAVRDFDLPFVTELVLAELAQMLRRGAQAAGVPFFTGEDGETGFRRLGRPLRG